MEQVILSPTALHWNVRYCQLHQKNLGTPSQFIKPTKVLMHQSSPILF